MLRTVTILAILIAGILASHALIEHWVQQRPTPIEGLEGNVERGAYVLRLAGCVACHTDPDNDGSMLAGGRRLQTPFGTFITPNITPDRTTGIGGWTVDQFYRALALGVSPNGEHYYPSFPYPSYSRMTRQDIVDLKAYLDTVPAIANAVPDHDLNIIARFRGALAWWKWLYFTPGEYTPEPSHNSIWNRGAYIVKGPGHCGECHTPRGWLGGSTGPALAGNPSGPEGETVPPLAGDKALVDWTFEDMVFALQVGMKPDGDSVGGSMGEVIDEGTSHFTEEDLNAMAQFLLSPREAP